MKGSFGRLKILVRWPIGLVIFLWAMINISATTIRGKVFIANLARLGFTYGNRRPNLCARKRN